MQIIVKMDSEQHHYELRSRSRSRSQTPRMLNRSVTETESSEHHYDLRSRSRERSHTPGEVTSTRRSGSRSLPSSAGKSRDKSMETISEKKEEVHVEDTTDTQSRKSEGSTSSVTKKAERRSERQRAKKQIFVNGQGDSKNDSLDDKVERKRKSITPRRILTSDYSSEEGEREDPPSRPGSAYEIYKQAGEWWNVFPKTDYTYSQKSTCRYEIAPGVLAMPNMSRRSIHSDSNSTTGSIPSVSQQNISQTSHGTSENYMGDTVDTMDSMESAEAREQHNLMSGDSDLLRFPRSRHPDSVARGMIYKTMHVEHYKSHREILYSDSGNLPELEPESKRYSSTTDGPSRSFATRRYGRFTQLDSDTELDDAVTVSSYGRREKWRRWYESVTTVVITWWTRLMETIGIRQGRGRYYPSYDYRRHQESKWSKAWRMVDRVLQSLYLLLVRVLFLDSWLLSRASNTRERLGDQRRKILWLILLPPLLLAAWWFLPFIITIPLQFIAGLVQQITESSVATFKETKKTLTATDPTTVIPEVIAQVNQTSEVYSTKEIDELKLRIERLENDDPKWMNKWTILERNIGERDDAVQNQIKALRLELQTLKELQSTFLNDEKMEKHITRIINEHFNAETFKQNITAIFETLIIANQIVKGDKKREETKIQSLTTDPDSHYSNYENSKRSGLWTEEDIKKIMKEMIKIYDADKTGKIDHALESAGGQIISTRCTQPYKVQVAFKFLGFTWHSVHNDPRTVIQRNPVQPGACWAFQDFPGYLLIKLRGSIFITGFTMEHASRWILPNGEMRSAPRKFDVWGLENENDAEPVRFGDYEFLDSDDNLQYFPVQNTSIVKPYEYVELKIHSNHGQLEYTCLYRFRVHGVSV
ncbi:uncharacterized protein LOC107273372 isoform X2 [Cephus cinctus]|uniref:Uncharacterized protein LOC107273372 isoform X2 n=1 Tax=Cephus cinctus TaxID=211228 RepID=A0AAJ7CD07_CEPCN|nr:uncharacterized protein LOC107273372 isoform X2 [Cephus cinctus]